MTAASSNVVRRSLCRACGIEHRARHYRNPKHPQGIYHTIHENSAVVYEVRVADGKGRRVFEVVGPSFTQAKARLAELRVVINKGSKVPSNSLTVSQLADEWWMLKGDTFKARTRDAYELQVRKIKERFGRAKVRDVSGTDLAIWLKSLGGAEVAWAVVRQIFGYAVRQGDLVVSPCDMVDPSDRPKKKRSKRFEGRVYSDEEITRLCAFAGSWLQEIIVIGRYSGMRLGEILALDHESLDFEKREIHVIGTVRLDRSIGTTKSGEERIVPMHSEVEKVLRGKRGISGPVFRTQCGQRRSVNKTSRAFREVTGKAEIDGRFHDLRHTFASKLANSPEIPIAVTSRILGHADLSTTMKYVHPVEDGTLLARLEAAT